MAIVLWALVLVLIVVGLVGVVLPALPGTALVLAGIALAAWIDGFTKIGGWTLFVVVLLAIASQAADLAATALGARKLGGGSWGLAGALVGMLVGLLAGPFGMIAGAALGAVVFELAFARKTLRQALKAGAGAFLGFLLGTVVKAVLTVAMIALAAAAYMV